MTPLRRQKRCHRLRYYIRLVVTHLFSHVGLCALVVGYAVVGALLFEKLEGNRIGEPRSRDSVLEEQRQRINDFRLDCLDELWNITVSLPVLKKQNWTDIVGTRLKRLEGRIVGTLSSQSGASKTEMDWSFSSALLYSVTVITTIGYGHITPKTDGGKVVTIFYALLGVPMMLLCLTNIGHLMANTFRFAYWSCHVIGRPRKPACATPVSPTPLSEPPNVYIHELPDLEEAALRPRESVSIRERSGSRRVSSGLMDDNRQSSAASSGCRTRSGSDEVISINASACANRPQVKTDEAQSSGEQLERAVSVKREKRPSNASISQTLDKETHDILKECAEYMLCEQLGIGLDEGSRGNFQQEARNAERRLPELPSPHANNISADSKPESEELQSTSKSSTASENRVTFSEPAATCRRVHPPTPPCRRSSLPAQQHDGQKTRNSSQRVKFHTIADEDCASSSERDSSLSTNSLPQVAKLPVGVDSEPGAELQTSPLNGSEPAEHDKATCGDQSSATRSQSRSNDDAPCSAINDPQELDIQSLPTSTQTRRRNYNSSRRSRVVIEHPHLRKISSEEKRMRRIAMRQCLACAEAGNIPGIGLSTASSVDSGVYASQQRLQPPQQRPDHRLPETSLAARPDRHRPRRVPIPLVLGFVTMYICMGAGIFAWWEEWRFLDGAYFCFITLSTIGFGDLVPGTQVLKAETQADQLKLVFCCLYLIMGLAIIAMSFSLVQEEVVAKCKQVGKCTGILHDSDTDET